MKKFFSFLMVCLVLAGCMIPTIPVNATSNIVINGVDIGYADGDYFTKNGKSCANSYWASGRCHKNGVCDAATHSQCNCMRYWPTGNPNTCKVDLQSSQCFGFARYCQYIVYGYHDGNQSGSFSNITGSISEANCTASNLKSKLLGCAPATHIRTGNNGHSVTVVSTSDSGAVIADCNYNGYCIVRVKTYTWAELATYFKSNGYSGIYYAKAWNREIPDNNHTHTYTGSYFETDHPHKQYQSCACGDKKYTGVTEKASPCVQCDSTLDTRYEAVNGFKAYPCVSANFEVYKADMVTSTGGVIFTTDLCTINKVFTNGWCEVTYPVGTAGDTKTAYTRITNFIKSPPAFLSQYTAMEYIDMFSTSAMTTKTNTIYPDDVCFTVGSDGTATQIFMPKTGTEYYVLGWVSTATLQAKTHPGTTEIRDAKAPTCATEGYTGSTCCADCGDTISFGESIDKLPHTIKTWTVVSNPTANLAGRKIGVCEGCNATITAKISKLATSVKQENIEGLESSIENVGNTNLAENVIFKSEAVDWATLESTEKTGIENAITSLQDQTANHNVVSVFDLQLLWRDTAINGDAVYDSEFVLNGTVKVTIPISAETLANYENVKLLHIKDDGTAEILPFTLSDGTASFETTGFSYYAFIGTQKSTGSNDNMIGDDLPQLPNQANNDHTEMWIICAAVVALAAVASVAIIVIKKVRQGR